MLNKININFVIIIALLIFCQKAHSQIQVNAPYYLTSLGSQDYPTNGYALFDIDHQTYNDFVIVRTSKFQYFKGVKGGYNNTLASADNLFANGATDNSVKNSTMVFMDVDNDGDSNLVFRNNTTLHINKAIYNTATSKYDVTKIIDNADLSGAFLSLAAADMNGDGRQDLVTLGTSSSGGINLYKQQANGTYIKSVVRASAITAGSILINDIDGDNDNDIIVLSGDGKMYLFKNNGTGTFTETTPITNLKTGRSFSTSYTNFSIGDVNNDGRKDLVISSYSGVWVSVYLSNINGTYSETVLRANNAANNAGVNTTITDIDGDGDMDIVVGQPISPSGLSYFENIGNTSFSTEKTFAYNNQLTLFTAGLADDFDRDGKLDYLCSYNVYINFFRSSQAYYTSYTTASVPNTYIAGPGTDNVSVVISNPFSANIKFNAVNASLSNVTITNNNTPSVTITGLAADVQVGLKSLSYTGTFRGEQYFDIDITSGGTTNSMRVGVEITNPSLGVLPLNILNIQATRKENIIAVEWQTSAEVNTAYFTIERSANGVDFTSKGSVSATLNPSLTNSYSWNDVSPLHATNYYRIKSVDRDGAFTYSKIVKATFTGMEASLRAYPVPAASEVQFTFPPSGAAHILTVYSNDGRIIEHIKVAKNAPSATLTIGSYPAGVYWVRGQNGLNTKFIKL